MTHLCRKVSLLMPEAFDNELMCIPHLTRTLILVLEIFHQIMEALKNVQEFPGFGAGNIETKNKCIWVLGK